jgi:hypothetical protein
MSQFYIQFRIGGPNGYTLTLKDPLSGVGWRNHFNGQRQAYRCLLELQKPADLFPGKHTITFTDFNKKVYHQEFEYKPFSLETDLGKSIAKILFLNLKV